MRTSFKQSITRGAAVVIAGTLLVATSGAAEMEAGAPALDTGAASIAVAATAQAVPDAPGMDVSGLRHIGFEEAVQIALAGNTTLKRARNASNLDRVAVSQARMAFMPDLRLGASAGNSYAKEPGFTIDGTREPNWSGWSGGANLSSSITLFDGFADVASLRAAQRQAEAGLLDTERTRQTVVIDVITGYLGLIAASEQERVRQENLAAQEEQERLVSALVEGGERPISDLYLQQAAVASARLSLVQARRDLELNRLDLVQALQLDPLAEYVFDIPEIPEQLPPPGALNTGALITRAFEQRPDLVSLLRSEQAAREDQTIARAGRLPQIGASASYGTHISEGAGDFGRRFDDGQSGSVGFSLSMPLFDRGATSADIQRAKIGVDNARLAIDDARQQVALQVRQAVLDWSTAEEQLQAADAQVLSAQQALNAVRERYEVGAATLTEVTLARADLVSATSTRVNARYNLLWQGRLLDYYVGDLNPEQGLLGGRG